MGEEPEEIEAMNAFQLCVLLAIGEKDVIPGKWEMVRHEQEEILRYLREDFPVDDLQLFADHAWWAVKANEVIEKGLMTGPLIKVAGAERVIELARARGLTVPKADVAEALFASKP
jgi:hypothetical protein